LDRITQYDLDNDTSDQCDSTQDAGIDLILCMGMYLLICLCLLMYSGDPLAAKLEALSLGGSHSHAGAYDAGTVGGHSGVGVAGGGSVTRTGSGMYAASYVSSTAPVAADAKSAAYPRLAT
jgi:hypothetical protein